ncbi:hypothetical protein HOY80DRAFT_953321 [Tuber brumale]|nr:hypothetical protein HOY80DRAFT_953321 [Tuber brumale]
MNRECIVKETILFRIGERRCVNDYKKGGRRRLQSLPPKLQIYMTPGKQHTRHQKYSHNPPPISPHAHAPTSKLQTKKYPKTKGRSNTPNYLILAPHSALSSSLPTTLHLFPYLRTPVSHSPPTSRETTIPPTHPPSNKFPIIPPSPATNPSSAKTISGPNCLSIGARALAFSNRRTNSSTPPPISVRTSSSTPAPPKTNTNTFQPGTDSRFLSVCRTGEERLPSITTAAFRPEGVKVRGLGGEPSSSSSAGGIRISVPGVVGRLGRPSHRYRPREATAATAVTARGTVRFFFERRGCDISGDRFSETLISSWANVWSGRF